MIDRLVNRHRLLIASPRLRDELIFLVINWIPRCVLTRFVGWLSMRTNPVVRETALAFWRLFDDIDLSDAKKKRFTSLHDLFTRELRDGTRPIDSDPAVLASPCDAVVGACGPIFGADLLQAKGLAYPLAELISDAALARHYDGGCFATLRLKASMYHRFHAPHDCTVQHVTYVSGDTWNVNPISVARIERLFCRNERAVIRAQLRGGRDLITLVPVAAILVASIRLHFLNVLLHLRYRGPHQITCDARFDKGQEMGWFQHGSTMVMLAPAGFALCEGVGQGALVRVGNGLMRRASRRGHSDSRTLPG
jgi:phosphatidylserine decarboxylase